MYWFKKLFTDLVKSFKLGLFYSFFLLLLLFIVTIKVAFTRFDECNFFFLADIRSVIQWDLMLSQDKDTPLLKMVELGLSEYSDK